MATPINLDAYSRDEQVELRNKFIPRHRLLDEGEETDDATVMIIRLLVTLEDTIPQRLVKRDDEGRVVSPNHDRFDRLRSQLSGWHFSKESLSKGEREILYVAEQVLGILDELCGGYLN
jgi:hypothetical protein